jgi:uncharacterized protein (TIGR02246 family)
LPDAQDTIDQHLAAVTGRDLDVYLSTIHPDITVVIPNGDRLRGAIEVAEFHREWFADRDWTYEVEHVDTVTTPVTATRFVNVTYRDSPGQQPRRFIMGLTFVRYDGRWLLIHDQCTPLP